MPTHDPPGECYFPSGLFAYRDDEVLFDCGAFDGDSLRQYLRVRAVETSPQVVAFEPDALSFKSLSDYVKGLPETLKRRIRIAPWAVAETTGSVGFSALGSVRSGVTELSDSNVHAVALDDLGIVPSLIKMDVEGFELSALKGATDLLRRHQPVLAISLYHHAVDLWTIPKFIKELVPDYRLFLRRYAEDCWESVMYAIPTSRHLDTATGP
jgi:FkbM family methyltransferase